MNPSEKIQAALDASSTISDRIRELDRAGCTRSEIAKLVGRSYQHVRNVLVEDARRAGRQGAPIKQHRQASAPRGMAESAAPFQPPAPAYHGEVLVWVEVGIGGLVQLPEQMRTALDVRQGGKILSRLDADGSVTLLSAHAAMLQAQAIIRAYVPEGASLVDELLAERRAEAARENEGG